MSKFNVMQNSNGIQFALDGAQCVYWRPHRSAEWFRTSVTIDRQFFFHAGTVEISADDIDSNAPYFNGFNLNDLSAYVKQRDAAPAPAALNVNGHDVKDMASFTAYAVWLASNLMKGVDLVKLDCPNCSATLMAYSPPEIEGGYTNSFATCPVCDTLYHRVINRDPGSSYVSVKAVTA